MEYLFLLYGNEMELAQRTPEQNDEAMNRHMAIIQDANSRGVLRSKNRLQPIEKTLVARSDGKHVLITDGPFAETKETLGGYYLIDCADEEEAKYWGGRLAQTGCAIKVEIRAVASTAAMLDERLAAAAVNA